jgi:hypothetical protein
MRAMSLIVTCPPYTAIPGTHLECNKFHDAAKEAQPQRHSEQIASLFVASIL